MPAALRNAYGRVNHHSVPWPAASNAGRVRCNQPDTWQTEHHLALFANLITFGTGIVQLILCILEFFPGLLE